MALVTIIGDIQVPLDGTLRLFHGTDTESASLIQRYGFNLDMNLMAGGTGELWLTTDRTTVSMFAQTNPRGGPPIVLGLDLPVATLTHCLSGAPPLALMHGSTDFEFYRASFSVLNESVTNIATETSITFDL